MYLSSSISFTRITVNVSAWLKQNQALVITVLKVSAAILAGGLALIALGAAFSVLGTVAGAVATIITGIGTAIGFLRTILGALLTPHRPGHHRSGGLGRLPAPCHRRGRQGPELAGREVQLLKDTALKAYQGIADALAAGDIGLAARILWRADRRH